MKYFFRESTFKAIYLTLAVISLTGIITISFSVRNFITPTLLNERINKTYSLIHSQHSNIIYNNNRSLINELVSNKTIKSSKDFEKLDYLNLKDKVLVEEILKSCRFYQENFCIHEEGVLIFHGLSQNNKITSYNYVISLKTNVFNHINNLRVEEVIAQAIFILLILLIAYAIRQKEKKLIEKVKALSSTLIQISDNLSDSSFSKKPSSLDEIETSLSSLNIYLREKVQEIEDYKRLFQKKTKLEQIGLTVAQVSHDLKGPLNEVQNFLNSFPKLITLLSEEDLKETIMSLEGRVSRAKQAIDLSLKQTKRSELLDDFINLYELVDSTGKRLGINIKLIDKGSPIFIKGSKVQMETVFENLFRNSLEAKKSSSVVVDFEELEGNIRIRYQDNGPGIKDVDNIFEPFVTTKESGAGFGLSSCRSIIETHSGSIKAFANGKGARFEIEIPSVGIVQ